MTDCVHVDLGDGNIQLMEVNKLRKYEYTVDNDNERTTVTEYHLSDMVVHRSVNINLKKGIGVESVLGRIG